MKQYIYISALFNMFNLIQTTMKRMYIVLLALLIANFSFSQSLTKGDVLKVKTKSGKIVSAKSPLKKANNYFLKGVKANYLQEGFETAVPPATWTVSNLNTTKIWTLSADANFETPFSSIDAASTNSAGHGYVAANCDEKLITSQINATGSTTLTLKAWVGYSGPWMIGGSQAGSTGADVRILISPTGAAPWTQLWSYSETHNGDEDWTWNEISIPLQATYGGTSFYLAFQYFGYDGDFAAIDGIQLYDRPTIDLMHETINTPSIISSGMTNITGTIKNNGANDINSYDLSYTIDGETPVTTSITGVNIASDATATYTHPTQWNATTGTHSLVVNITNINGSTDANPADNTLTKTIYVASQTVPKMCLIEGFTSSTCAPCKTWNTTFNPWAITNDANMNYIKYQVNWPGTGDPYYIQQAGDRTNYYNNGYAPYMFANGVDLNLSVASLNAAVALAATENTAFSIDCTPTYNGDIVTIPVTINPYVTISDLKVHVVVCEKKTTGNVGNNGETEWHHVMMQMLPSSSGTTVSFTDGTAYTNTLTKDMSPSTIFVEEMSDLIAIVFIQDNTTKQVLQSKTFPINQYVGINDPSVSNIQVYPNPTSGIINITNAENAVISVYNMLGEVVATAKNVNSMDLSNLLEGNYIVKIQTNINVITQKINLVK